jgi:hypothetical protein
MTHKICLLVGMATFLLEPSTASAQLPGTDLAIAISHRGNFTVGMNGVYTIVVSNIGGAPSSGRIDVFELFTSSVYTSPFTYVSAVGTGWSCSYGFISYFDQALQCSSSSVITAGGSAPPITLTVIPCCSGTLTNGASVSGGGDTCVGLSCLNHTIARDPTIVLPAVPTLPEWAMIVLTVLLVLAGFAAMRRRTTGPPGYAVSTPPARR